MRPSTTSVATSGSRAADRRRLGAVLGAELICAVFLVGSPLSAPSGPAVAAPVSHTQPAEQTRTVTTADGRTAALINLGAPGGDAMLDRIAAGMSDATAAVTGFWGPQWRRDISIVIAGSSEQFAALAAGTPDTAATTTAERIMFAPGATAMNDDDLRTVLRHELFHYAARADTAADAPVWLTEGVADFVARPAATPVPRAPRSLPTDAELATPGPERSTAYDRAWQFASHLAGTYGTATLRDFYVAACRPGHSDVATAFRQAVGIDLSRVLDPGAR